MGAVAKKIEGHEVVEGPKLAERSLLPARGQRMELAAFLVGMPATIVCSLGTCVLTMWAVNGGGETAWTIWALMMTGYGLVTAGLVGASLADR